MACVSPLVNKAEPCTEGKKFNSILISLTSFMALPSILALSRRTLFLTISFSTSLNCFKYSALFSSSTPSSNFSLTADIFSPLAFLSVVLNASLISSPNLFLISSKTFFSDSRFSFSYLVLSGSTSLEKSFIPLMTLCIS